MTTTTLHSHSHDNDFTYTHSHITSTYTWQWHLQSHHNQPHVTMTLIHAHTPMMPNNTTHPRSHNHNTVNHDKLVFTQTNQHTTYSNTTHNNHQPSTHLRTDISSTPPSSCQLRTTTQDSHHNATSTQITRQYYITIISYSHDNGTHCHVTITWKTLAVRSHSNSHSTQSHNTHVPTTMMSPKHTTTPHPHTRDKDTDNHTTSSPTWQWHKLTFTWQWHSTTHHIHMHMTTAPSNKSHSHSHTHTRWNTTHSNTTHSNHRPSPLITASTMTQSSSHFYWSTVFHLFTLLFVTRTHNNTQLLSIQTPPHIHIHIHFRTYVPIQFHTHKHIHINMFTFTLTTTTTFLSQQRSHWHLHSIATYFAAQPFSTSTFTPTSHIYLHTLTTEFPSTCTLCSYVHTETSISHSLHANPQATHNYTPSRSTPYLFFPRSCSSKHMLTSQLAVYHTHAYTRTHLTYTSKQTHKHHSTIHSQSTSELQQPPQRRMLLTINL